MWYMHNIMRFILNRKFGKYQPKEYWNAADWINLPIHQQEQHTLWMTVLWSTSVPSQQVFCHLIKRPQPILVVVNSSSLWSLSILLLNQYWSSITRICDYQKRDLTLENLLNKLFRLRSDLIKFWILMNSRQIFEPGIFPNQTWNGSTAELLINKPCLVVQ